MYEALEMKRAPGKKRSKRQAILYGLDESVYNPNEQKYPAGPPQYGVPENPYIADYARSGTGFDSCFQKFVCEHAVKGWVVSHFAQKIDSAMKTGHE